jgi:uncharacterized NAD-dependent epimerase/dehydratase family protein
VTTSILHGAQPDSLVFCHVPGRTTVHGYERFQTPAPRAYADLYERISEPVSEATVDAGMVNTQSLSPAAAQDAVDTFESALGVPATDPIRFDADDVLDAVL